jgi:uncharacterized protein
MPDQPHFNEVFRQRFWQSWRDILFVHWQVDPAHLRAILPDELEPDLFEGRAYVGLVPFRMTDIRPVYFPSFPYLSKTLETNLRTYVRHKDPSKNTTPAVWFFSLEAANPFAVIAARLGYGLNYFRASMWLHELVYQDGSSLYSAESLRHWPAPAPVSSLVQAWVEPGQFQPAHPGTLEHFLVERYALFAGRQGKLNKALVRHEPYRIKSGELLACNTGLFAAAGLPMTQSVNNALVHRAADVRVRVG